MNISKKNLFWIIAITSITIVVSYSQLPDGKNKKKSSTNIQEGAQMKSVQEYLKDTYKKGMAKVIKTDEEWKKLLTSDQFRITRNAGTEAAFCGVFYDNHKTGLYLCVCCDLPLFASNSKFDSGTGWPSFFQPVNKDHIAEKIDQSFGMRRVEINCARCDAHLGHVFEDGPKPTGLRYCLNSDALKFVE